jgi:hypothetical protein
MDILKMLTDLRAERQRIEEAILVMERLATGSRGKRRGRPPKWMSAVSTDTAETSAPKKKRVISAAGRRRMAEAQQRRWAGKKAQAKQATA